MRILIAGASGFIGQALFKHLQHQGHELLVLGRNIDKLKKIFGQSATAVTWQTLDNSKHLGAVDVVINLAGENLAAGLWTQSRKQRLYASRINTTKQLINWCHNLALKPACFICASGIGIYPSSHKIADETTAISQASFLAHLAYDWELATQAAQAMGMRVVNLRLAPVLSPKGGLLKPLLLVYRLGLAARLGTGKQPFPWIALPDVVHAIEFIISHAELTGPVNLIAPEQLDQASFAKTLAQTLHRPYGLMIPAALLRLLLGELAEELLLTGIKAQPLKLMTAGFHFICPTLRQALTRLLPN